MSYVSSTSLKTDTSIMPQIRATSLATYQHLTQTCAAPSVSSWVLMMPQATPQIHAQHQGVGEVVTLYFTPNPPPSTGLQRLGVLPTSLQLLSASVNQSTTLHQTVSAQSVNTAAGVINPSNAFTGSINSYPDNHG